MVATWRARLKLSLPYLWRGLLWSSLSLVLTWLVLNFSLSWQWIDRPFAGFLHQNQVITRTNLPGWQARRLQIGATRIAEGDLILMVDGQPLPSSEQLLNYLNRRKIGHSVSYLVRHRNGQEVEASLAIARFTRQDFVQLVLIPAFMALLALLTAGAALYVQAQSSQVQLMVMVTVALVLTFISLPDLILGRLFMVNFVGAMAGKILLPPLLFHFLLIFPYQRRVVLGQPALLPLLYAPALPSLLYLPHLLSHPELVPTFKLILNGYLFWYALMGAGLLLQAALAAQPALARKQALVLLAGLVAPTLLAVSLNLWLEYGFNRQFIFDTVEQYGLIGLPIAAAFAAIRYQVFQLKQNGRLYAVYLGLIGGAPVAYIVLIALVLSTRAGFEFIRLADFIVIIPTVLVFWGMRPLYGNLRDRLEQRLYGRVEDFRVGLRIFQQELLKVKSRHDLEERVSWNIVDDFKLRGAELAPGGRPRGHYALRLPLSVNNVLLGTLFLGGKINGEDFTERERAILSQLQQQMALALWSLELDTAVRTTEQLTRLKSKFLANVTHELRTPLNSIINYIGFVVDGDAGPLNAEQQLHLGQALHNAEKLLHLINNILDISKIEAGQMSLRFAPVNLAELISETLPQAQPALQRKPVRLLTELAPTLPPVQGDRLRLRQIILNLLSNAAKFTEAGTVQLKAYAENGSVVIQVADTGRGIEPAHLPRLFEQFTQEGLADQAEHAGAGLSLPISKALVELHGGQIQVESQVGQGTVVTVKLPVEEE